MSPLTHDERNGVGGKSIIIVMAMCGGMDARSAWEISCVVVGTVCVGTDCSSRRRETSDCLAACGEECEYALLWNELQE